MASAHDMFTPDDERESRCGFPEVIYAAGKTPAQVSSIAESLLASADVMLATRASYEHFEALRSSIADAFFIPSCNIAFVDRRPGGVMGAGSPSPMLEDSPSPVFEDGVLASEDEGFGQLLHGGTGHVIVACAGTSDLPVAREAAFTARIMGSAVTLMADVGVAGIHRLLDREDILRTARAIVVVAGMEGALPSVVAGLVDVPVVAVPTSVGYGASFGGIAALLGMLNSCAGGVSVVNIDNGFGAGVIADRINRPPARFIGGSDDNSR